MNFFYLFFLLKLTSKAKIIINKLERVEQEVISQKVIGGEDITHVLFDIDHTLFVNKHEAQYRKDLKVISLHPVMLNRVGTPFPYYAINFEQMKIIFKALVEKDIKIGFITNSFTDKWLFLKDFKILFNLPKNTLKDCIFINIHDLNSEVNLDKGYKIKLSQQRGVIPKAAKVLVVDDDPGNIVEIKHYGYKTIHACGFPRASNQEHIPRNNNYLKEIILACKLDISLPPPLRVPVEQEHILEAITELWDGGTKTKSFLPLTTRVPVAEEEILETIDGLWVEEDAETIPTSFRLS